jgi:hypothetical protein
MPVRSKWQSLPTEQINPATLAIDKLSPADIVEGMLNEDRKMLAAVQREKEHRGQHQSRRRSEKRPDHLRRRRTSVSWASSESAECHQPSGRTRLVRASAGGKVRSSGRAGVEDNYEEGAIGQPPAADEKDVVIASRRAA